MTNTIPATEQGYGITESNNNIFELMSGIWETAATLYGNQVLASMRRRPNSITLSAVTGG